MKQAPYLMENILTTAIVVVRECDTIDSECKL